GKESRNASGAPVPEGQHVAADRRPGHRRSFPSDGRLRGLAGTESDGRHAGAPGSHARWPSRPAAAARRRAQTHDQGRHHPGKRGSLYFLDGPGAFRHGWDARVCRNPDWSWLPHREHERRPAVILAVSSMGIFGIVLGGWASNSHYSLLGALRSAAQLVSYEVAVGMAMVSGLLLAGTLSMKDIVASQAEKGVWFAFVAPVGFVIYLIGSVAETNRAPFDLPEAESELVAGYMTE